MILVKRLYARFWAWVQFPWHYPNTYTRTCTRCGSTQELVLGHGNEPYIWRAVQPFNYSCPHH